MGYAAWEGDDDLFELVEAYHSQLSDSEQLHYSLAEFRVVHEFARGHSSYEDARAAAVKTLSEMAGGDLYGRMEQDAAFREFVGDTAMVACRRPAGSHCGIMAEIYERLRVHKSARSEEEESDPDAMTESPLSGLAEGLKQHRAWQMNEMFHRQTNTRSRSNDVAPSSVQR